MPKQKTHRGSAKRFKRTGSGGLKRFRAFTLHTVSTAKLKNNVVILRKASYGCIAGDFKRIHQAMLSKLEIRRTVITEF